MTAVVLDTSVASHLHPKRARAEVREFFEPHLTGSILTVTFQTQAELWAWAEDNRWGPAARAELDRLDFKDRFHEQARAHEPTVVELRSDRVLVTALRSLQPTA